MLMRIVVLLFTLGILYSLGSAAYYLVSKSKNGKSLMRALIWRVSLSVVLFLLILLSYSLGWLHPRPPQFLLNLEAAQQRT